MTRRTRRARPLPWIAALVVLAACPKPRKQSDADGLELGDGAPSGPVRTAVAAGPWSGGGLSMRIPSGWTGDAGEPGDPHLLHLVHESGLELDLVLGAHAGALSPPPEGCEPLFADQGTYESVPGLRVAEVASCLTDDGIVQGWYGFAEDRPVHVQVRYPSGGVVRGRKVIDPMLQGLRPASDG